MFPHVRRSEDVGGSYNFLVKGAKTHGCVPEYLTILMSLRSVAGSTASSLALGNYKLPMNFDAEQVICPIVSVPLVGLLTRLVSHTFEKQELWCVMGAEACGFWYEHAKTADSHTSFSKLSGIIRFGVSYAGESPGFMFVLFSRTTACPKYRNTYFGSSQTICPKHTETNASDSPRGPPYEYLNKSLKDMGK